MTAASGLVSQAYEIVPLARLRLHPENPRRGQVNRIAESIEANGFYGAVIAQRSTGLVLAGNHRLAAARSEGLTELPVIWLDVDDDRARRILVADNRLAELAAWDEAQLLALLRSVDDVAGTGFTAAELAELVIRVERRGGLTDPDEIPEPPAEPVTRAGDLWLLGEHRLLCGDSTAIQDVRRLMAGERATLMVTDPPYLVDYDGGNHPQSKTNSAMTKDRQWDDYQDPHSGSTFFQAYLRLAVEHALAERSPIYQWHADMRRALVVEAWEAVGLLPHQVVLWVKSNPVLTRSDFMWQHEPCLYGWVRGKRPEMGRRPPAAERSVWEVNKQGAANDRHPTEKPVELFTRPVGWHTRIGEVCYEPFGGAGTCLIAAAMLGRRCYAMELAPQYADVICRRFQEFTGTRPVLEATSEEHDFTR